MLYACWARALLMLCCKQQRHCQQQASCPHHASSCEQAADLMQPAVWHFAGGQQLLRACGVTCCQYVCRPRHTCSCCRPQVHQQAPRQRACSRSASLPAMAQLGKGSYTPQAFPATGSPGGMAGAAADADAALRQGEPANINKSSPRAVLINRS
jgi:hypothetical protein